jgi:hypothetical protein
VDQWSDSPFLYIREPEKRISRDRAGIRPISWGSRRYLIPADDLVDFCNSINGGREPRTGSHGFHLLRRGDEKKKVTLFPKVPDEYKQYLLAKP